MNVQSQYSDVTQYFYFLSDHPLKASLGHDKKTCPTPRCHTLYVKLRGVLPKVKGLEKSKPLNELGGRILLIANFDIRQVWSVRLS